MATFYSDIAEKQDNVVLPSGATVYVQGNNEKLMPTDFDGTVYVVRGKFKATAAHASGTIIKLVRLPKGARLLNSSKLFFEAGQSASLTVKVGDEADDDRYFAAAAPGASAVTKSLEANVLADSYEFPKEQWVTLTTGGAALTSGKIIAFEIFFTKYG